MDLSANKLNDLLRQVDEISLRQEQLQQELMLLKKQALELQKIQEDIPATPEIDFAIVEQVEVPIFDSVKIPVPQVIPAADASESAPQFKVPAHATAKQSSNVEKFIGENLINKVGIGITILGVAFGAKYAIDHDLLSPIIRVVLGYCLGAVILIVALGLRKKYTGYSSVLAGGSMAIFYLISFSAYNYYELFSQSIAFLLMVIITAATIYAALRYDQQVLAQIGLVGAYSVPFLLSDNSGRVVILFSYIALINIGILIIAFKKAWKFLFYSSFVISWAILSLWVAMERTQEQFTIAMVFISVYYAIFFCTFLSGIVFRNLRIKVPDLLFVLINCALFYSLGMDIIASANDCTNCLVVFTLSNACLPFVFYQVAVRKQTSDTSLLIALFSLFTLFILIAITDFFEGQWITIICAMLTSTYFILGRIKGYRYFEMYAYPLLAFVLLSLAKDWAISNSYYSYEPEYRTGGFFVNLTGLASVIVLALVFMMWKIRGATKYVALNIAESWNKSLQTFFPLIFFLLIYCTVREEISGVWVERYQFVRAQFEAIDSDEIPGSQFFKRNHVLWVINFSFLFLIVMSWLNISRVRDIRFGRLIVLGSVIALLTFLTQGLLALRYLREDVVTTYYNYAVIGTSTLRYFSFLMVVMLITTTWRHVRQSYFKPIVKVIFDCLMHLSILWLATSEMLRIFEYYNSSQMYKLGLTILWGVYALFLIILGIWKRLQHLRIMGIIIFGVTLIKLLIYDLDNLSTIEKAGLFILIGLFLLFVSYLYLRFKKKIFGEESNQS